MAQQRLGYPEAVELLARVADGLEYAHQHKIIHRDIAPKNILIDVAGRPFITDFGLARREEPSLAVTLEGQVLSTPAYMAPEQAAGESAKVDGRRDVYSVGVILYEMLTGARPFSGSIRIVLHQVIHDEPRPPRRMSERVPRDLETICLKCLHKEPARRYAGAGEPADDLRRYLKGVPITARPVSSAERAWRWCRRNPLVSALAAALVLAFLGWYIRAELLRARAERAEHDIAATLQRTREALSHATDAQGVLRLEAGDGLGLFDLLAAGEMVPDLAEAQESRALLWSGWHAACAGRLAQVMGENQPLIGVDFSPDGRQVATATKGGTVQLWDAITGKPWGRPLEHRSFSAHFEGYQINSLAFSPDSRRLATASFDHAVRLWDTATGKLLYGPLVHKEQVHAVAFGSDGRLFASGSFDGTVKLWDADTGRLLGPPLRPSRPVLDVRFHPRDSRVLAMRSFGNSAWLWDITTGRPRGLALQHQAPIAGIAFSPDGKRLASASRDLIVSLWDPVSGTRQGQPFQFQAPVQALAFSPGDGRWLATASADGTARLWDPPTRMPCGPPFRHEAFITSVVFTPDRRFLLTGSFDQTVRLWQLPEPFADLDEMRRRTHVALGARLNAHDAVEAIPWQEWQQLRDRGRK